MTEAKFIVNIINDKSAAIDKSWCDKIFGEYPYFSLPLILYLQRNGDNISQDIKNEITGRIAMSSTDRKALYSLIGSDKDRFKSFYPPEKSSATPDTETTIDTFIKTFGNADEREIKMLNQMIFNPVPDYSQILASEEKQNPAKPVSSDEETSGNDILINKFIAMDAGRSENRQVAKHPVQTEHTPVNKNIPVPPPIPVEQTPVNKNIPVPPPLPVEQIPVNENIPVSTPVPGADSMLSESLAKIYIKQHKYAKALEIIKSISLKFPEKSIYFADQIRFLQKLIINEQFKIKN